MEESPLMVEDLLGKDADDEDGLLRLSRPLRNAFTTRICNAKEKSSKVTKSKSDDVVIDEQLVKKLII